MKNYVRDTTAERDNYRKNTSELLEQKLKLEKEKAMAMETFKKRIMDLDREMKSKTEECNETFEAKTQLEKEKKNLVAERERMKERIKKLKQKRGKFDVS